MHINIPKQIIYWIIVIMWVFQGIACSIGNGRNSTLKSDEMELQRDRTTDKFDLPYYQQKIREYDDGSGMGAIYTEPDGTQVDVSFGTEYYFLAKIKKGEFRSENRIYYRQSLYLKRESTLMYKSSTVLLGMRREYNEQGYLVNETNEDRKFDGLYMKPLDVLKYLQRLGYLNLKTGAGQEHFGKSNELNIFFSESPKKKSIFDKREPAVWVIDFFHDGRLFTHTINAETGEVMSIREELMEE
jgi:hypothetical protein